MHSYRYKCFNCNTHVNMNYSIHLYKCIYVCTKICHNKPSNNRRKNKQANKRTFESLRLCSHWPSSTAVATVMSSATSSFCISVYRCTYIHTHTLVDIHMYVCVATNKYQVWNLRMPRIRSGSYYMCTYIHMYHVIRQERALLAYECYLVGYFSCCISVVAHVHIYIYDYIHTYVCTYRQVVE